MRFLYAIINLCFSNRYRILCQKSDSFMLKIIIFLNQRITNQRIIVQFDKKYHFWKNISQDTGLHKSEEI